MIVTRGTRAHVVSALLLAVAFAMPARAAKPQRTTTSTTTTSTSSSTSTSTSKPPTTSTSSSTSTSKPPTTSTSTSSTTSTTVKANQVPTANAGPDRTGTAGVTVSFDGSGSFDPDGTIAAWYWQFGDGGSLTTSTSIGSHAYTLAGTYRVTLWVRDNAGAWSATSDAAIASITTGSTTTTVANATTSTSSSTSTSTTTSAGSTTTSTTLANKPPTANAGPDQATQTLITITLNGSGSSDPDGTIALASWNFGDGTSASGLTVTHAYATAATYTATLTVVDNKGASSSDSATVTVVNRPPIAVENAPATALPNTTVTFDGTSSTDPDGSITSYAWNFGDGTTGSGSKPTHAYSTPGTYTTSLTVTDNNGARGTDSAPIAIGSSLWARSVGSTDSDAAWAVASDGSGNVFIGGSFHGTVIVGGTTIISAGGTDCFIAKYSSAGAFQWVRRMGGTSDDSVDAIAVDGNGDVVVAGRFSGTANFGATSSLVANGTNDMVVAKYSGSNGAYLWARSFGGAYTDQASAVAVDPTGNVYFTGYFSGTVDFGGGPLTVPYDTDLDVFVTKLSSAGAHVWSKHFTNTGNERGYGIAVDGNGNVSITGYFSNDIDFGGGTLTSANGMTDIFVARFTAAGAYTWARRFGAPDGNESGYAAAMDSAGNVVVAGYVLKSVDLGGGTLSALGNSDAFVAKYSAATGAHLWSRRLGGTGNDYAYGVDVDGSDNVVVGGSFEAVAAFGGVSLTSRGAGDGFVAKYGSTGTLAWAKQLGGADNDIARAIGVSAGSPVAAGYFSGTGTFDSTSLTSAGLADVFLVRLAP